MIWDFGMGIFKEKLFWIFDVYYLIKFGLDDLGKGGFGFGLVSCKEIVEWYCGKICVESM